ncbi:MAG TPA: crosslink repair DNA glycosylase YcaQ family protein [Trebonia sp.]|nr:crosslink repair DNA glycosylase YcaQ family protein [Trebonia sp.]
MEDESRRVVRADFDLSPDEARRIALRAQGFLGAEGRHGGVAGVLRRLSAVQLDTISVLARSHELVPYARLGAVGRDKVEQAFWHPTRPKAFEYWAHAACVLPLEDWPYYAARRRGMAARGQRWHKVSQRACDEVLARLRAEGPLTATQLGGAKAGGPWWDWSEVKIAAEWLLDTGQAACVRRTGWRRVYDVPERVIPRELLEKDPSDVECLSYLVAAAVRALGIATHADIGEYQRLNWHDRNLATQANIDKVAEAAGLVPVTIAGARPLRAWADPAALDWLDRRGTHRTTLLSPFDSLIWDRKRTLRMFGFQHVLEAYVPREKRVHGYYAMPLLSGGRLVGRVDPARDGRTLIARQVTLDSAAAVSPMARALTEAAAWVGCDNVIAERTVPHASRHALAAALRAQGGS